LPNLVDRHLLLFYGFAIDAVVPTAVVAVVFGVGVVAVVFLLSIFFFVEL